MVAVGVGDGRTSLQEKAWDSPPQVFAIQMHEDHLGEIDHDEQKDKWHNVAALAKAEIEKEEEAVREGGSKPSSRPTRE